MTVETILLYIATFLILVGVFIGDGGIETTFQEAGPFLGAKIEKHIETGSGFTGASFDRADAPVNWSRSQGSPYRVEGL